MSMGGSGYGQAIGGLLELGGGVLGGLAADKRRKTFQDMMNSLPKPNVGMEEGNYFTDLNKYLPQATSISNQLRQGEMTQDLALREQALPGIGAALRGELGAIAPAAAGQFAPWMQRQFASSGGAIGTGSGFGGSGFGGMQAGFGGLSRAMQMQQQYSGLLTALMGTMPNISAPTTSNLLGQLLTPEQRVNLQMQLRQQQIGMNSEMNNLPTSMDAWSATLNRMGAQMMGSSPSSSPSPSSSGTNLGSGQSSIGFGGSAGSLGGGWAY